LAPKIQVDHAQADTADLDCHATSYQAIAFLRAAIFNAKRPSFRTDWGMFYFMQI